MNIETTARNFVLNAPRERVWNLIGKVIFSSLPGMEEVEILDEKHFCALLKVRISFSKLAMKLRGEIVNMAPPHSLAVDISLEGLGGLFRMKEKVVINMTSIDKDRTTVTCKAIAENMGILLRWFSFGQARRFAQSVFETIERRLQNLT